MSSSKHPESVSPYLSGTFRTHQRSGFWHFLRVFRTFGLLRQNFVPLGGVCVYFLKSVRKGHFKKVWVGGGGVGGHIFEQTELQIGRCTERSNARGTIDYSESESSSLVPPSTRDGALVWPLELGIWTPML